MKYSKKNNKIFIRLKSGDEIMKSLYQLMKLEQVASGWIMGIGACKKIEIGYYNGKIKDYTKKYFNDDYEITSLSGNFTTIGEDQKPWWHIHINFSDKNFNVFGGHLFTGIITATCEIIMITSKEKINRKLDSDVGLCLWDLNNG